MVVARVAVATMALGGACGSDVDTGRRQQRQHRAATIAGMRQEVVVVAVARDCVTATTETMAVGPLPQPSLSNHSGVHSFLS